jgi:hypothetical protein
MKVYIITRYIPYEDCEIVGVYKDADVAGTERATLQATETYNFKYFVEEWEVIDGT